ncbi:hypothetical protein EW026_g2971 [Hermanssonia centrifuga]|uniref:F-box domain-containing protein n=1 Tax=Hermanssonia centrifuga TaxID=98765 RepID=A0A4S4KLM2_9APHY|nr:hypothetical protein EW026_g2971 [Hermanssonia centrifuga]
MEHQQSTLPSTGVPPELCDYIIDFLGDDKRALSICSLVCKGWASRARFWQFRSVQLSADRATRLERLLRRNPQLGSLIRHVFFNLTKKPTLRAKNWIEETLRPLAVNLSAVNRLDLDAFPVSRKTLGILCMHFSSVEYLGIFRCLFEGHNALFGLCSSLPLLQELQLHDPMIADGNWPPTPVQEIANPNLSVVRFTKRTYRDPFFQPLVKWLLSGDFHSALRTFEIIDLEKSDIASMQEFLNAVGPTLQTLYIGPSDLGDSPPSDVMKALDLTPCTGLLELGIWDIRLHLSEVELGLTDWSLDWVICLLKQVRSPFLQHVQFYIHAGGVDYGHLSNLNWAGVAQALSDSHFGAPCRVTFTIVKARGNMKELADHVKPLFGALNGRIHWRVLCYGG